MTLKEIKTAALLMDEIAGNPHAGDFDVVARDYALPLARLLLAALAVVDQARAHRDMAEAVTEFDKVIEELRP